MRAYLKAGEIARNLGVTYHKLTELLTDCGLLADKKPSNKAKRQKFCFRTSSGAYRWHQDRVIDEIIERGLSLKA